MIVVGEEHQQRRKCTDCFVPRSDGGVPGSDGVGGLYAVVGVYVLLVKENNIGEKNANQRFAYIAT